MNDDPQHRSTVVVAQRSNLCRYHFDAVDDDTHAQALERGRRRKPIELDLVLFLQLEARVRNAKEQLAVIGQQQEARRLAVQPADRDHTLRDVDEVEYRAPSALIG
jgi:hypothetical protein